MGQWTPARRCLLAMLLGLAAAPAFSQELPSPVRCDLNAREWDQVRCLLAPVKAYGALGKTGKTLPSPWQKLFLDPRQELPSADIFGAYLRRSRIPEDDVGGALAHPISENLHGEKARYFIIHDTSILVDAPGRKGFPSYLNGKAWSDREIRILGQKRNAHVFVGRTGQSSTAVDFGEALVTTKFEKTDRDRLEGLFVGVENIQPRIRDRRGMDSIAPQPGFTQSQLKRLAIVYVAASIRARRWLIPAFHAVLDNGIKDGHDDPQHFDLDRFSAALTRVLSEQRRPIKH